MNKPLLRKLARELVISILLTPVVVFAAVLVYFRSTYPAPADYSKVPPCSASVLKPGETDASTASDPHAKHGGHVATQDWFEANAPKPKFDPNAPYTIESPKDSTATPTNTSTCISIIPIGTEGINGPVLLESPKEAPWPENATKFGGRFTSESSSEYRYIWLPDGKNVGRFDLDISDDSIKAAISRDFPHTYTFSDSISGKVLFEAGALAVCFGSAIGVGLWILYRLVRFAITG